MSDFTVLRSLDGYCLVLDKKRIAGGKPDYRGENVLVDWTTEVVYGPVDDLAAENAKLRELVSAMPYCMTARCLECPFCSKFDPSIGGAPECMAGAKLHELGVEVG